MLVSNIISCLSPMQWPDLPKNTGGLDLDKCLTWHLRRPRVVLQPFLFGKSVFNYTTHNYTPSNLHSTCRKLPQKETIFSHPYSGAMLVSGRVVSYTHTQKLAGQACRRPTQIPHTFSARKKKTQLQPIGMCIRSDTLGSRVVSDPDFTLTCPTPEGWYYRLC